MELRRKGDHLCSYIGKSRVMGHGQTVGAGDLFKLHRSRYKFNKAICGAGTDHGVFCSSDQKGGSLDLGCRLQGVPTNFPYLVQNNKGDLQMFELLHLIRVIKIKLRKKGGETVFEGPTLDGCVAEW